MANYTRELADWQILLQHSEDQSDLVVLVLDELFQRLHVPAFIQTRAVGRDLVLKALNHFLVRAGLDLLLDVLNLLQCLCMVHAELVFR